MSDVGKYKADVAAAQINKRIVGTNVIPHCCRIEDMSLDFYKQFNVFVLGLDSLEARRYMNMIACDFLGVVLSACLCCDKIVTWLITWAQSAGWLQNTMRMAQ